MLCVSLSLARCRRPRPRPRPPAGRAYTPFLHTHTHAYTHTHAHSHRHTRARARRALATHIRAHAPHTRTHNNHTHAQMHTHTSAARLSDDDWWRTSRRRDERFTPMIIRYCFRSHAAGIPCVRDRFFVFRTRVRFPQSSSRLGPQTRTSASPTRNAMPMTRPSADTAAADLVVTRRY